MSSTVKALRGVTVERLSSSDILYTPILDGKNINVT